MTMSETIFTNLTADEARAALTQAAINKRGGIPFDGLLFAQWRPLGVEGDIRVEIQEANPQHKKD